LSNAFTQPDDQGFYFIDRDPTFVLVIVNYLRGGLAAVDLDLFTPAQLRRIHSDAEFYMVPGLQEKVDELLRVRGPSRAIVAVPINSTPTRFFNGVFMQITPTRNVMLNAVTFFTGEKRPLVARAMLKECDITSLAPTTQLAAIGEVDQPVDKMQRVTISITALQLHAGKSYVLGVCSSASNAVGACPKADAARSTSLFSIDGSFHTTDPRFPLARKVEGDFDFVGELTMSNA